MTDAFSQIKSLIPSLSPEEQEKVLSLLKENPSISLESLVNIKENQGVCCPECGQATTVVKNGRNDRGVQRFFCKQCKVSFTPLSYTFISNSKKTISDWIQYVHCMIEGYSIRKSAEYCNISIRTAFFWRHKILDVLRQKLSRIKLRNIVEADDTFFRESYKGNTPPDRESYKRGSSASKRGISSEQICVSTAVDRDGRVYGKVSARGRVNSSVLKKVLGKRIDSDAVLCTDNDSAYKRFARVNGFEHIIIQDHETKGVYHVNTINGYHSRLKAFMRKFNGVSSKYLDNYLSWLGSIFERKLTLLQVLKAAVKEDYDSSWLNVKDRPLMPV